MRSEFLATLHERGFIHQLTDAEGLDALAAAPAPMVAYIGFDATADSLHVGSLLPIMLLRRLQQTGHKPIVLMGGGTSRVGDPSGKDASRSLLTLEDISRNIAGIRRIFARFLRFGDGPTDALMIDNADWLAGLNYIDFLRDYGRHFSVGRMLSFDSVKLRLEREQPLSFLEFNYMILQAYDFLELRRRHNCRLQMGGSDQWGNIVNGIELARRCDNAGLFGLTTPLLTTASGAKMGKTADGAVWLNGDRCTPHAYWQFWRNCEDGDVGRFLRLFTEEPMDDIRRLEQLQGAEINAAKKCLADAATRLCHGTEAAEAAAQTARRTFEDGAFDAGLPITAIARSDLAEPGLGLLSALCLARLADSNGEARRHVQGGAVRVNDRRIDDPRHMLQGADADAESIIKLSLGRKRHALLRAE